MFACVASSLPLRRAACAAYPFVYVVVSIFFCPSHCPLPCAPAPSFLSALLLAQTIWARNGIGEVINISVASLVFAAAVVSGAACVVSSATTGASNVIGVGVARVGSDAPVFRGPVFCCLIFVAGIAIVGAGSPVVAGASCVFFGSTRVTGA